MSTPLYQDPKQPIDARVADLMSRMTVEEKVGQMLQLDGRVEPEKTIPAMQPGSMLQVLDEDTAKVQALAARTRLGIPLLLGIDAIHGHSFKQGATIFPTQIGLACSWNTELAREVGRITALEMSYTGVQWTFSPVLCIARDARWGRVGETFGEDPFLIGEFASAMIKGYQGSGPGDRRAVIACAKHLAGYSETHGGLDSSEADISRRKLRAFFLPGFERVAREGVATFMIGYQSMDGVPCSANRWLLTDVLRTEWGFSGVTVTDWDNVRRMHEEQHAFASIEESSVAAANAGNDLIMSTPRFYECMLAALKAGRVKQDVVDEACRRVLRLKFAMGLFEDARLPDPKAGAPVIGCDAHRDVALRTARESVVLLKNDGALLPLNRSKLKRIAVIGPNADDPFAQLGDWTLGTGQAVGDKHIPREATITVLDGIRAAAGKGIEVVHAKGCSITDSDEAGIDEAVRLAASADVTVVAVGDVFQLMGECKSTATLELLGGQQRLLRALHATGKPVVAIIINSKPLIINWLHESLPAILEAWNPGMLGGQAIAEILFGDVNPQGKLTISFPRHAGQIPVYYNRIPGAHSADYADLPGSPLYPFGHGLSYTKFEYSNLRLESAKIGYDQPVVAFVDVRNTGPRDGVEIVQTYLNDKYTSATWPRKVLKAYARVALKPGQSQTVRIELSHCQLAFVNAEEKKVVEPGAFELLVGSSSRDSDLLRVDFSVVDGSSSSEERSNELRASE